MYLRIQTVLTQENGNYNKLFFLGFVQTVDVKTDHSSITVINDETFELVCHVPGYADIKGCLFTTPSGNTYILWAGSS